MARKPAKKSAKKRSTSKRTAAKSKTAKKAKSRATSKKKSTKKATSRKSSTKKKPAAKKTKAPAVKKAAPVKKVQKASKPKNTRTLAYTQSEFVENIRSYCGIEKRSDAKELCEDIARFMTDALKKGYRVPFTGLGKMYVRKTKARMGRNPATGELIHIPARKRVRFTVAKALKDAVL